MDEQTGTYRKGDDYRRVFVDHLPMGAFFIASKMTEICPSCDEYVEPDDLGCDDCIGGMNR